MSLKRRLGAWASEWSFLAFLAILFAVVAFSACRGCMVSEDVAVRALETNGFSDIKITDHDYFALVLRGGSTDDAARFTAEATNPVGKRVTVEVYTGWLFKGATIRTR